MTQSKLFLHLSLAAFVVLATVFYSSCKKDPCSGVVCENNGVCSGGACQCPSGYSGVSCEYSSITFINDTYTPVAIAVNGSSGTIAYGSTLSFAGISGSSAVVTATTTGSASGTPIGNTVTWSFTDNFPTDGATLQEPLDVDASQFYLFMVNNSSFPTNGVVVNVGLTTQSTESIIVNADGNTYGIGYYPAYSNTQVEALLSGGSSWTSSVLYIPNTLNASATVTIP